MKPEECQVCRKLAVVETAFEKFRDDIRKHVFPTEVDQQETTKNENGCRISIFAAFPFAELHINSTMIVSNWLTVQRIIAPSHKSMENHFRLKNRIEFPPSHSNSNCLVVGKIFVVFK